MILYNVLYESYIDIFACDNELRMYNELSRFCSICTMHN